MEFAIFLTRISESPIPSDCVKAHVEMLHDLEAKGQLIACGPFADGGGLILASFQSKKEAEIFASNDPFVCNGYSTASIRQWEWSRMGNAHLGILNGDIGEVILNFLDKRVTVRNFLSRPVDKILIMKLLETAHRAPSEFNLQPWRPVVCYSKESREKLKDCCFGQKHVGDAAVDVIVGASINVFHDDVPRAVDDFINTGRWKPYERDEKIAFIRSCYPKDYETLKLHAVKNAMLFGHQLLIAGYAAGLAGFWLGGIDEEKTRAEFGIPTHVIIAGVVGLGWPRKDELHQPRIPVKSIVSWDHWGKDSSILSS